MKLMIAFVALAALAAPAFAQSPGYGFKHPPYSYDDEYRYYGCRGSQCAHRRTRCEQTCVDQESCSSCGGGRRGRWRD